MAPALLSIFIARSTNLSWECCEGFLEVYSDTHSRACRWDSRRGGRALSSQATKCSGGLRVVVKESERGHVVEYPVKERAVKGKFPRQRVKEKSPVTVASRNQGEV
jgi:hypothetical protein